LEPGPCDFFTLLVRYATPEVLFYVDVTGQIHASRDDGATWAAEAR